MNRDEIRALPVTLNQWRQGVGHLIWNESRIGGLITSVHFLLLEMEWREKLMVIESLLALICVVCLC